MSKNKTLKKFGFRVVRAGAVGTMGSGNSNRSVVRMDAGGVWVREYNGFNKVAQSVDKNRAEIYLFEASGALYICKNWHHTRTIVYRIVGEA